MASKPAHKRFGGLIAPVINALTPEGKLNLPIIDQYADLLEKNKVTGAFVCGTAGEGTSLTLSERKQVVAKWVEASKGRIRIIAHIGTNCLEDAKELARHAQEVKADAVALVAPHYIRPESVEALVDFTAEVAKAAHEIPFFYYHFPDITNVRFTAISYLRLASKKIPNLQGIKFTHHDFHDFGLCVEYDGGKYDILNGYENVVLAGLSVGTPGSIGITFSLVGPHYAKIFKAWEDGDIKLARKENSKGVAFYSVLQKYGVIRAHKALLKIKGLDLGPVRLPLVDLTQPEIANMLQDLKETELYNEYF